jgi:osmotically-inducible protein OsmY
MTRQDEQIRDALADGMAKAEIDSSNLQLEVVDRAVIIKGTVPTPAERDRLARLMGSSAVSERTLQWDVRVA